LRQVDVGAVLPHRRAVGALGHDGAGGDEQARARDHPLIDRPLDRDVGIARALGAQVAQRCEAGHQRGLGLLAGAQGAIFRRLLQHLIVPQRLVIGVQQQMGVQVHQARDQGLAGQIDHLDTGGRGHSRGGAGRHDALALDQHHPTGMDRLVRRPDLGWPQQDRGGRFSGGDARDQRDGDSEQGAGDVTSDDANRRHGCAPQKGPARP